MLISVGCLRNADEVPTGAGTESVTDTPTEAPTEAPTEEVTEAPTEAPTEAVVAPEREFELGIYVWDGSRYILADDYRSAWPTSSSDPLWIADTWTYPGKTNLISDIAYFGVFPFSDETHANVDYTSEYMSLWREAGLDGYKIGFEFTIKLRDGGERRFSVLSAEDTFKYEEYFEIYLYDDITHAWDSWYSHVTEWTDYEDTLYTTFKLTLREGCYDVDYIAATAFVYHDAAELDADGFYTGANKMTAMIGRKS